MNNPVSQQQDWQGSEVSAQDGEMALCAALNAAVDYRGDVTLHLKNGNAVTAYVFNFNGNTADYFLKTGHEKRQAQMAEIDKLVFSGRDTASH